MKQDQRSDAMPAAARGPRAARDAVDLARGRAGARPPLEGPLSEPDRREAINTGRNGDRGPSLSKPAGLGRPPPGSVRPSSSRSPLRSMPRYDHDDPTTIGGQTFPPGTYSVPQPTAGRDPPRDVLDGVRRPLLRRGPPVLEPVVHDPHLQQRPRRDVEPVAQRPRPGPAAAARRPDRLADDERSDGRPGRRPAELLPRQCPPVGFIAVRRDHEPGPASPAATRGCSTTACRRSCSSSSIPAASPAESTRRPPTP